MPTPLAPLLAWTIEGESPETLDPRLPRLLAAIRLRGSLAAAVGDCGLSYRAAWDLLGRYAERLGGPLVALQRGRGAQLTLLGERLQEGLARAERTASRTLAKLAFELPSSAPERGAQAGGRSLRIAASHDLALAALAERLGTTAGLTLEIQFRGSFESLAALAHNETDLAGFHWVIDGDVARDPAPYLKWLDSRRHRLFAFLRREQGLIVARGNPHRVRDLADLARRGLTFVNRQRGSGTRLLVDGLLAHAGIAPAALAGYRHEEFTHAAVAATVAAGRADAGFGVRAAASQFGLGFVPLCHERYCFAVRASALARPEIAAFQHLLRGAQTRKIIESLAGYAPDRPGTVIEIADAFRIEPRPRSRATTRARSAGRRTPAKKNRATPAAKRSATD